MSFDIFNDIHIARDNDRLIAMAEHLSLAEVTRTVLRRYGVFPGTQPRSTAYPSIL
jgi:hypothetical protein